LCAREEGWSDALKDVAERPVRDLGEIANPSNELGPTAYRLPILMGT
jgi:hypothetical protein